MEKLKENEMKRCKLYSMTDTIIAIVALTAGPHALLGNVVDSDIIDLFIPLWCWF